MNRVLRPVTHLMSSEYVPSDSAHEYRLRVRALIKYTYSAMINLALTTRSMGTE